MKRQELLCGLVAMAFSLTTTTARGAEENPVATKLVVMTYNLRYASPVPPNAWPARRPLVIARINEHQPDLIGTQEGLFAQLNDLADGLPNYAWLGLGREGGSRGEFMAIFYRKDRFRMVAYDHYWLSDTPNVIGSASWGNSVRRMVTWARLKDLKAGRELVFINTHFDHVSQPSREKSAALVLERTKKLGAGAPIILTGDFNAAAESNAAYKILVDEGKFVDSWTTAARKGDQVQTFNGFRYPAPKTGERIDWILSMGPVRANEITIDATAENKRYPSDHFPVIATFTYE